MASDSKTITHDEFRRITRPLIRMMVRHPRAGFANTLLANFGRVSFVVDPSRKPRQRGQASLLLEPGWRIEHRRKIIVGSDSTKSRIAKAMMRLDGMRLVGVDAEGDLPELVLNFDSGWVLRSFRCLDPDPNWCIFLIDKSLFPKPQRTPSGFDHWLKSHRGRLVLEWAHGRNPHTKSD